MMTRRSDRQDPHGPRALVCQERRGRSCAPRPAARRSRARRCVRTLFSGISRGTERLVFNGAVGQSEWERMRGPNAGGRVSFSR